MKKLTQYAITAAASVATALGLAAPAMAAPSGPSNALETVKSLEAQGYNVVTNKLGSAPLDQSAVIAVRQGQDVTHHVAQPGEAGATEVVRYRTVYVDIA
ncbi:MULTISPECIES: hypothetical protein [unclassified Mycobacterium]|uniref:hypothetical protein n=1 Tax=unclassified Mycobacterium TaxID=2642494 RepID=UPI0029C7066A|nr:MULTISPECIES: hypothetical protein [unclassified Mycobacterium]